MFFYSEDQFLSASGGGTFSDLAIGSKTYRIHKFTSNSTLTFKSAGTVEYLIVGGGAAGGAGFYGVIGGASYAAYYIGNGGNAGSMLTGSTNVAAQTYSIVVGAASSGAGNYSSVFNVTASGGDFKGSSMSPINGIGASGTKNGLQSSIDGTIKYYAGGGGAGGGSPGGLGGGGSGGVGWSGNQGTPNTGGGGGGGQRDSSGFSKSGGVGAAGIVIVRYQIA